MSLPVLAVDLGPGVLAGFTSRAGGGSVGPWAGLDLALHVGDDSAQVRRNRDLLTAWVGAPVQFLTQVHGADVHAVGAVHGAGGPGTAAAAVGPPEPECDAVVSAARGAAVGVLVADCVPVLLADLDAEVVAAAHAGRRGLLAGVLERTVATMVGAGARPERIRAAIGPAAGACCYEVPERMRAEAVALLPELWGTTRGGTPSLDLASGCRAVLGAVGVGEVSTVGICTIDDARYYSYRRAPVTGRFAGVVRMLP